MGEREGQRDARWSESLSEKAVRVGGIAKRLGHVREGNLLQDVGEALATAEAQVAELRKQYDAELQKFRYRARRAEAQVEELTRENAGHLRYIKSKTAQLEVYREALYAIQNEPSCSPVVHELAGNALAGEKP